VTITQLDGGGRIEAARGDVVVAIALYGAHEHFVRCLTPVLEHTPATVPILVADDHGPDPASLAFVEELESGGGLEHTVHWLRRPGNLGFVGNVNAAFAVCDPADVVVLNSDCEVAGHWLDGLREAAMLDSDIATASALSNHATILSGPVPHRNRPSSHIPSWSPRAARTTRPWRRWTSRRRTARSRSTSGCPSTSPAWRPAGCAPGARSCSSAAPARASRRSGWRWPRPCERNARPHRRPGARARADPRQPRRPGFVDTPLSALLLGMGLDARREQLRETLPIGQVVGPQDVAAVAVHLMVNTALTGATYDVDGGQQLV
jgi:hypothetical protein